MSRFLVRRFAFAVALVVTASSSALLLTRLTPGDLTAQLGDFASERDIASERARYDLDRSPIAQWGVWASRAIRFDFGNSFLYSQPVAPLVRRAAFNTFTLGAAALALATCLGLGLGLVTGSRAGWVSSTVRAASLMSLSMPPLITSLLLVFAAARTGWLPAGNMSSVGASDLSWTAWLVDLAWHLPLPVVALALPMAASFERLQAQALSESMRQPFVRAAAAKGVGPRALVLRHAWRASLSPICGVYGVAVGALLSGSFIVEHVTAWPGLGMLMFRALDARDIYLVAGCAAAGASLVALGTFVGDVLLFVADPRVRETQPG